MRKRIKCSKCGLYFREREKGFPEGYLNDLCWNCGFLWKCLGLMIESLGAYGSKLNRYVSVSIDNVEIKKWKRKIVK